MAKEKIEVKQCTQCKRILPATPEYFHVSSVKNKRTGLKSFYLRGICKRCINARERERGINQASYARSAKIVYQQMKKEGIKL